MPSEDARQEGGFGDLPPEVRWNFRWTVANGAIVMMGTAFFAFETVLAGLAESLTGSSICVGLLITVSAAGSTWPQLFVGHWIESKPRKMPLYQVAAGLRVMMLLSMAATVFLWRGSDAALYWLILIQLALFCSSGGMVVVPFMDIVGKSLPKRHQSMLWAYRRMLGGVLGFLASLVVVRVLSEQSGIRYPANYALLLLVGTVVCAVAYGCFMVVREPVGAISAARVPFKTFLKRGPQILRADDDYRRLNLLRYVWAGAAMAQAVFVPFVRSYFEAPTYLTGWFTAVVLLAGGLSSLVFGKTAQRWGEILVLRLCCLIMLLAPLFALLLAGLHDFGPTAGLAARWYVQVCILMYCCHTVALNGHMIAGLVYLLALPAPDLRPTYIAFLSVLTLPLLLAPTLAGALARTVGYPGTFFISCVFAVAAFVMAGRLTHREEGNRPNFDGIDGPLPGPADRA